MRNASYLGSAKISGAPLGLLALALTGRSLTPALFGTLMIIHAYVSAVGDVFKFQTWQFIVQYAAPALHRDDRGTALDAVRLAFGLDILTGLIAMVVAILALPFIGRLVGIDHRDMLLATVYCALIPTMSAATATGVLRVLDRFDLIAIQQFATPALRALGAALTAFCHFGFVGFVATWFLADVLGDLLLWWLAWRELRKHDLSQALRPGLFGVARRLPGAWAFAWTTNLSHTVYSAWGPVSNLVVAFLLGPTSAGLYRIAGTLLDGVSKPADLLARGFYPEVMRLDPNDRRPWLLAVRTGAIAAAIGLAFTLLVVIGGEPLIRVIFGRKYLDAYDVLRLMTASLAISMGTFSLEPLLYMVGRQGAALVAQLLAAVVYLVALILMTERFGLTGAGAAYVFGTAITAFFMLLPTVGSYRHRTGHARHETSMKAL